MHGFEIDPSIDEQQLVDEEAIRLLLDASEVSIDDTVVEIGPGVGNITSSLLERVGKLIVVEKNPKYRSVLKGRLGNDPKLEIIIDDALYYRFPAFDRIVSNLPYMISEPIIHRLFKLDFKSAAFIVSKSFSDIVTNSMGKTKLSYLSRLMFESEKIADVGPEAYLPSPKTPTTIIIIRHRTPENRVDRIMQAVFRQEDKKTGNALREALIQTGEMKTKRSARQVISELEVSNTVLDIPVARLSFDQINILLMLISTQFQ